MIYVENLHKRYKMGDLSVHALKGVSVNINAGEFVAIMGPSGSGKSTFMNIIGCLDRPTEGAYILDKNNVENMDEDELAEVRNKKIGFVFQTFNLIPRHPALRQVMLPMLYNPDAVDIEQTAKNALNRVGLGDRLSHKPNELSGGQQQRVAIARAIATNPLIMLGDEPTGNLDTRTSEEIMDIFQQIHQEGKTVIIVTHEEDIAKHAQRIIKFRDGYIVSDEKVDNPLNAKEVLNSIPFVTYNVGDNYWCCSSYNHAGYNNWRKGADDVSDTKDGHQCLDCKTRTGNIWRSARRCRKQKYFNLGRF
jgi:putative ABC transport system ATP-binding protein